MKKLMTIAFALALAFSAAAQHGRVFAGTRVVVASPYIGFGYGLGYAPFYYSPFGYYPYGYYPYGYNSNRNNSKLQTQIEDIKSDYKDKIWSAKQDKSLSKDERDKIILQLKTDRDKSIHDLKMNYYKPKSNTQSQDNQSQNSQSQNTKG
jgi:hypothetical protein